MNDYLITNFESDIFQNAFKEYFKELGINVNDWNSLFKKMNDEGGNFAFIRINDQKQIIGFIQFKKTVFTSWFFEETTGCIREFWIKQDYRNNRHGSDLLKKVEDYFKEKEVYKLILTTDTAEKFYLRHGFVKDTSYKAKNEDDVYIKILK